MTDKGCVSTDPWCFGGYPYGLEPLRLPPTGVTYRAGSPPADARSVDSTSSPEADAIDETSAAHQSIDPEALAWFRWITGHQICFLLWRLLADVLDDQATPLPPALDQPVQSWIEGYSAMLIYTGSCSREVYAEVIRPTMRRQHPAFSGGWAPDFAPVRQLLRGRPSRYANLPSASAAVAANQRVHNAIADWLVLGGPSLLREAKAGPVDRDMSRLLFDAYFLTVRQQLCRWEVLDQLTRRTKAVIADLDTNGLYAADDERILHPELGVPPTTLIATLISGSQNAARPSAIQQSEHSERSMVGT